MAALAQRTISTEIALAKAPRHRPRLANDSDAARAAPVREQHLMLEQAFSAPVEQPYPGAVKLALFVAVPIALWTAAAFGVLHALH